MLVPQGKICECRRAQDGGFCRFMEYVINGDL